MRQVAMLGVSLLLVTLCGTESEEEEPPRSASAEQIAPAASTVTVVANSSPPGATVVGGGRTLGITPFTTTVPVAPAQPGQVSTFTFTFTLAGHQPATLDAAPVNGTISVTAALAPLAAPPPSAPAVEPTAPVPAPAAARPLAAPRPPAQPRNPFRAGDDFRGRYVCAQGATGLVLRITNVSGNRVDAVFDFDHRPSRTTGAFRMSGNYEPSSRSLALRPGAWIRRPPGYSTVGMAGQVDEGGGTYSGRITGARGCTSFRVSR